ncbi:MAG: cyclopropane-fatty-acyl-phospholipid synthase [Acidobacteria bacterium]|nr:cyclopropane-fatty-acyl-phospholipid synthase [Acidobacteriota bacterium]MDA1236561.1 cyclopropane-fatty-acyl-phospholipid synthase [Acidobacteriota bacterium]
MSEFIIPSESAAAAPTSGLLTDFARRLVMQQLESLQRGRLTLFEDDEIREFGEPADLAAKVFIHNPASYADIAFGGSLGAAEAYIRGDWSADDLTQVCRIFARNIDASDELEKGWAILAAPGAKLLHWLHRNSKSGSGRNIRAHYDLGNDFFQLFLDPTMNYSAAIFERPQMTLEEASIAKMDRACRKLQLQPSDHLLEIGSGWGAMAIHAAKNYGCRVTTTTISREQFELAKQRVKDAGVSERVEILLRDYRDLEGQFDKIVSIEMIEAVGHEYLETYFGACSRLLKPDGMMLVQGITMGDDRYDSYRKSVDFIQKYVFRGSCLTSVSAMCAAAGRSGDLRPAHLEDMTPHYARTLRLWRENFFAHIRDVRALGYSESFIRLWNYYLCYCEAGFEEGHCGSVQLLLTKPRRRRDTVCFETEAA